MIKGAAAGSQKHENGDGCIQHSLYWCQPNFNTTSALGHTFYMGKQLTMNQKGSGTVVV
jgi:hypothetical protein